ncbi:MAG TPA: carboxypeptidase regulatory-like domain-containing protein [Bryobacteraceae bacterium]|nr:carboxypeptidase regulatory-like domain-containing protein [Bryobacteraceae bacterium]
MYQPGILLLLLAISIASAQNTGTLKGSVIDESGAVVPAVSVTVEGNGVSKTAQTQADGTFAIPGLAAGQYTVEVTLPGFAPFSKPATVTAGGTVEVHITLSVSTEKQELTVTAEAGPTVGVEPEANAAAMVIKDQDLQSLPDDPDDLGNALQALAGPGAGPNGGQIYIDGFTGGQLPPKETIREIRINQNPFSAEFDKLGFGRIEIFTKPGTDKFRAMLFLNYSNAVFDSRNPFASNKPAYRNRQYGGYASGPLTKKASYFVDFNERDILNNAITNAIFFDAATGVTSPINTAVVTPTVNRTIAPRVDYQLTANNTLMVRFEERMGHYANAGLGGYRLPPPYAVLAYNNQTNAQNLAATETVVLGPNMVNETRLQFVRSWSQSLGNEIPQINVANSFITGGNGVGNTFDRGHHYELQNFTSITHGTHSLRFGLRARRDSDQNNNPLGFNGIFTFLGGVQPILDANNQVVYGPDGNPLTTVLTSLQQYQRNVALMEAGFTQAEIQILGGGPSRFTIQAGESYVSMVRWDAAPFVQDDWRPRPNLTISLGLRYEVQTLISEYRDWAPRLGFAWSPWKAKNGHTTVIRGGFGIFYDRLGFAPFEAAALNNGHTQVQFTVYNPAFYPNLPPLSTLSPGQNTIYLIDPNLRTDYAMESAIGVERQVNRNTTATATYTYIRGEHYLQTVPLNAPLPGTFNPQLPLAPGNGVFPLGYEAGNVFQYESGGLLRQGIFMASFNTRIPNKASIYASYQLTYANDLPSMPSDPYNFRLDYGRSNLDRRHNFQLFGSLTGPKGINVAPFITLRSGGPFDVLAGEDLYGTTFINARAAFAPPGVCPPGFHGVIGPVVCSSAGAFTNSYNTANPINVVPRNYLTMAPLVSINMRVYRVLGFGPRRSPQALQPGGGGGRGGNGGAGGGMRMGPQGGGGRGGATASTTDRRFNLTLGVTITNLPNHFNPAGYQGVITSPQFLQPTTVNTGFGGGGVSGASNSPANNRRVEFNMRLNF